MRLIGEIQGKMSVRNFWLAGDPEHMATLTAETTQDSLDPSGI
jgi:hypothetical protein